jgi:hypothetical protein
MAWKNISARDWLDLQKSKDEEQADNEAISDEDNWQSNKHFTLH